MEDYYLLAIATGICFSSPGYLRPSFIVFSILKPQPFFFFWGGRSSHELSNEEFRCIFCAVGSGGGGVVLVRPTAVVEDAQFLKVSILRTLFVRAASTDLEALKKA